jgi:flap endonuclease-1
MGIKHLNRFLKEHCKQSIQIVNLESMRGKKIAVDISIYMYRYASDDTLLENMYLMLSTFRHYNIIPIFIFDGKPPAEKTELLKKRKEDKMGALNEYNQIQSQLKTVVNPAERQEMIASMELLKRTFVHIDSKQIQQVKQLIRAYGATYYDAPGEADELCAMLVIQKKVWACLSEDMDLFVYGCNRVLRYLSLANHTVVSYDLKGILTELEITQQNLREICVLSGTDYNVNNDNNTLHATLKLFKKFMRDTVANANSKESFYEWLLENTNYISDYEFLQKIYLMFDLSVDHDRLVKFEKVSICNGPINRAELHELLKNEGFLF